MTEKKYSGYIHYGHNFGYVTMQLGVSLEQYKIDENLNLETEPSATVTNNISSVNPSTFFTYNPLEKNQFQL